MDPFKMAMDIKFAVSPQSLVADFYKTAGITPEPTMAKSLVMEEVSEFLEETNDPNGDPQAELKEMADVLFVIYGYALARGWDLEEAFFRVYENNVGRMRQDDGTIKRREDGKVIKNPNYPKVDLSDLV